MKKSERPTVPKVRFKGVSFHTTKVHLSDVAAIKRAEPGKIYPAETIFLRLSATDAEFHMMKEPGQLGSGFVVIEPKDMDPVYLFEVIDLFAPEFFAKYQTTINLQCDLLKYFTLDIHTEEVTRKRIADRLRAFNRCIDIDDKIMATLKDLKAILQDNMLV